MTMITIRWSDGQKTCIESDSTRLRDLLARPDLAVWVDLESPDDAEFSLLKDPFNFHPLAIEDSKNERQRPKVEEYGDHLFLVSHETDYSPSSRSRWVLATRQIAVFARENSVVTVHLQPSQAIGEVGERCRYRSAPLERGPDFLVYALLDSLVDRYFPIIDQLDEQIDHLEERAVRKPRSRVLQDILELRRTLIQVRKLAGPTRELVNTLMTHDFPVIHSDTLPYLRDVSDRLIRIHEMVDTMRDLLAGTLDAHLSTINNHNESHHAAPDDCGDDLPAAHLSYRLFRHELQSSALDAGVGPGADILDCCKRHGGDSRGSDVVVSQKAFAMSGLVSRLTFGFSGGRIQTRSRQYGGCSVH